MKAIPRLLALAALLATAQISPAAAPSSVNYQGRFTNLAGVPQPGVKTMSLKIYDAATDGIQLYSEAVGNVTVDANGVYGFQFGASGAGTPASLATALAASTEQWLELTVDGAAQAPRQKILAVPFALTAGGLPEGAVSTAMIADGAVGLSKITGLGTAATLNTGTTSGTIPLLTTGGKLPVGTVDNVTVNAAIAADPNATRNSIELGGIPTTSSGNRLYWTMKRLENDRQSSIPLVIRTLSGGDSWMTGPEVNLLSQIGPCGQVVEPSWAILGGAATLSTPSSEWGLSPFGGRTISLSTNTSSHATFGRSSGNTARMDAARYVVVFYEGAVGNSFTVQYEDLSGVFQTLATVATDSVALSNLQYYETVLPFSLGTRVRVVWASGTPKIVAAGTTGFAGNVPAVGANRTGLVYCPFGVGGATMEQLATVSQASWNTLLEWLKPDIVTFREKSEVSLTSWTPNFLQMVSRIRTAYPACDFVLPGRHITGDGSESQNKEIDDYLRNYANVADNAAMFVDIMAYMPNSLETARSLGINRTSDGVHVDRYGGVMIQDIVFDHCWQQIKRFCGSINGSTQYLPRTMGSGFDVSRSPLNLFFDGTAAGTGSLNFMDLCGSSTQNHRARFGLSQGGAGMTGSTIYSEGLSFTNSGQAWLKYDSVYRGLWSQAGYHPTRGPAARLEMHSGGGSQAALAVSVPSGQTGDMMQFYTATTTSSSGNKVAGVRFDGIPFIPSFTTTARDALTSVPAGSVILNTTTGKLNFYTGSAWEAVTSAP